MGDIAGSVFSPVKVTFQRPIELLGGYSVTPFV